MNAVQRFESFLEGLLEGSFLRLFRSRLQPVDIAKRLERVMEAERRITWGRPLVPNRYQIALSQQDHADIVGYAALLQRELAQFVADQAAERGYEPAGPVVVTLGPRAGLAAGVFRVRAEFAAAPEAGDPRSAPQSPPRGAGATDDPGTGVASPATDPDSVDAGAAYTQLLAPLRASTAGAAAADVSPTLVQLEPAGSAEKPSAVPYPLRGGRNRVGRGLDNDLVLVDPSVSRHHAEIEWVGGECRVRDLGSSNGTWANGRRVVASERWLTLAPGDCIAFGAVTFLLKRET